MSASFARMTPAQRSTADEIAAAHEITGTLEPWSSSLSDDGRGCMTFGDDVNVYRRYSDGEITAQPHRTYDD